MPFYCGTPFLLQLHNSSNFDFTSRRKANFLHTYLFSIALEKDEFLLNLCKSLIMQHTIPCITLHSIINSLTNWNWIYLGWMWHVEQYICMYCIIHSWRMHCLYLLIPWFILDIYIQNPSPIHTCSIHAFL